MTHKSTLLALIQATPAAQAFPYECTAKVYLEATLSGKTVDENLVSVDFGLMRIENTDECPPGWRVVAILVVSVRTLGPRGLVLSNTPFSPDLDLDFLEIIAKRTFGELEAAIRPEDLPPSKPSQEASHAL